ncbi:SymE family type I addiction module toxin [Xanthomonas translucens]|uniref:SymE family type I addiction module toxin n=1 Tax=Xanthomonas campestris pv. translucens TaxID=343 RepID=UPI000AA9E46F|nr:SymE family type I addiction module toxin [Xanthomonas translucens]
MHRFNRTTFTPPKAASASRTPKRRARSADTPVAEQPATAEASAFVTPAASRLRFRVPEHCTMGYQHYDVRRAEDVVGCAVPKLRLSGRWLEQYGFSVGDALRVTVGRGVLLISRVPAAVVPSARAVGTKKSRAARAAPNPLRSKV